MFENFLGKSKNYIADILARKTNCDAGWIDTASEILSKYPDLTEDTLELYTAEKLVYIKQALDNYSNDLEFLNLLFKPELNVTQMNIILTTKNNKVSNNWIAILSNPRLPYNKANYIAQGMINGYNMAEIIDIHKFDVDQIYEIYSGIENDREFRDSGLEGLDYKLYCNTNIPAEKMGIIRHALQLRLDVLINSDGSILIYKDVNDLMKESPLK